MSIPYTPSATLGRIGRHWRRRRKRDRTAGAFGDSIRPRRRRHAVPLGQLRADRARMIRAALWTRNAYALAVMRATVAECAAADLNLRQLNHAN